MTTINRWHIVIPASLFFLCATSSTTRSQAESANESIVRLRMQELETGLQVGYSVRLVDVDGDKKKDIVVVDTTRVLWYRNPDWKKHLIIQGKTKPDNVCIAAHDIDGDGKVDFALGADWKGLNTKSGGTLQWLQQGDSLDEQWKLHFIGTEPTVHRIRFADVDGDGDMELIVVPLMGRGSSGKNNWLDGQPVRTLAFHIPKNPTKDRWPMEVVDQSLHVVHNFAPIPSKTGKGHDLLMASYEGVSLISRTGSQKWRTTKIGKGNQENPESRRGASEIKRGKLKSGRKFIATIEPWHGHQVVVYTEPPKGKTMWVRHVLDDELRWGHAVSCTDLDGDGGDELVIGVRNDPRKGDKHTLRRGIRVYKVTDDTGAKWKRQIVDNGGIATEDMVTADLNNDGRPDIVAVGRATHNMRIYWNRGAAK